MERPSSVSFSGIAFADHRHRRVAAAQQCVEREARYDDPVVRHRPDRPRLGCVAWEQEGEGIRLARAVIPRTHDFDVSELRVNRHVRIARNIQSMNPRRVSGRDANAAADAADAARRRERARSRSGYVTSAQKADPASGRCYRNPGARPFAAPFPPFIGKWESLAHLLHNCPFPREPREKQAWHTLVFPVCIRSWWQHVNSPGSPSQRSSWTIRSRSRRTPRRGGSMGSWRRPTSFTRPASPGHPGLPRSR